MYVLILMKHHLVASSSPSGLHQGGGAGEESATLEGADRSGEPLSAGGQFYLRGAGTTYGIQSDSADPIRQSER